MRRRIIRALLAGTAVALLAGPVVAFDLRLHVAPAVVPVAVLGLARRDPASDPAVATGPWQRTAFATSPLPHDARVTVPPLPPVHRVTLLRPALGKAAIVRAALLLALAWFVLVAAATSLRTACEFPTTDTLGFITIRPISCGPSVSLTPQLTVALCAVLAAAGALTVRWSRSRPHRGRR